jgi:Trk K+ transport system NAD-binding subunit
VRGDGVVVPRGDTQLSIGDEVLVLVTDESEPAVHALLIRSSSAPASPESVG